MTVEEDSGNVEIDYLKPRKGLENVGVRGGTMLFVGLMDGSKGVYISPKVWTFGISGGGTVSK